MSQDMPPAGGYAPVQYKVGEGFLPTESLQMPRRPAFP
jgi:hypothetical protein